MQIAVVLYDDLTLLDAVGPMEVLCRMPGVDLVTVGVRPGPHVVRAETHRTPVEVAAGLADVPRPDVVLVPGGPGQARLMDHEPLLTWLRDVDRTTSVTASVCTGALLLAAAGLLAGRRAATYWLATEELRRLGAVPVAERVVADGKYLTSAGVSAGIDLALTFVGRTFGDEAAQTAQLGIEYDPAPPYDAGSPRTAPPSVVERLRAGSRFARDGVPGRS